VVGAVDHGCRMRLECRSSAERVVHRDISYVAASSFTFQGAFKRDQLQRKRPVCQRMPAFSRARISQVEEALTPVTLSCEKHLVASFSAARVWPESAAACGDAC